MRKSDEDRFREFARTQAGPLRRSAYLLCGEWHLADDLAQQTLIKVYDAWPRIARRHQPVSYGRKTLLRCWLDERRRPWRRSEEHGDEVPELLDHDADPARRHEHTLARDELLVGCSAGTVKSQTARGLMALRVNVNRSPATTATKEER